MLESASNEQFLDSNDLDPTLFRRLVTRRVRQLTGECMPLAQTEDERREMEAILEKVHRSADFLPARFLQNGADRARAVCRIVTGRSLGTGFLIAPGFLMTNNHVIEDRATAESSKAEFGFDGTTPPVKVALRPERFFMTDVPLDFTIVGCDMPANFEVTPISLRRNPATVSRRERVNVIQHPRGRAKEVAIHDNRVERIRDTVIKYRTDTEPGSSGSPVFNNEWELVALHHAGVRQSNGTALNEGVRISSIVQRILGRSRRREDSSREMEMLLQTVGDVSPYFGFFDRLGIAEDDDLEVEVPGFTGTASFADVGFWNIEHFNDRITDERVGDVAAVIAQMQLNVLGLTEVQSGALARLQTALAGHGSNYGFELLDTRGAQDIAVLFDQDTTQVKVRDDIARRHKKKLRAKTATGRTVFPRHPMFVECTVDEGQGAEAKFLMIVVHLKAFGDAQSRERRRLAAQALAAIIEDVREREELPVVLGGDFNERINNDVLGALTGSPDLVSLTADDATTGFSFIGGRRKSLIDHIITTSDVVTGDIAGDDAAIVRLDQSIRDFADDISDHVPVVVRIVYRDAPVAVDPDTNGAAPTIEIPDGVDRLRFVREGDESLEFATS